MGKHQGTRLLHHRAPLCPRRVSGSSEQQQTGQTFPAQGPSKHQLQPTAPPPGVGAGGLVLERGSKRREKVTARSCLLRRERSKHRLAKTASQPAYHGNRKRPRPVKHDAPIKVYWATVTMEPSHKHT